MQRCCDYASRSIDFCLKFYELIIRFLPCVRRYIRCLWHLSYHIFYCSINCWNSYARSHSSKSSTSIVLRLSTDDSGVVVSGRSRCHHFLIRDVWSSLPVDVFLDARAAARTLLGLRFINICCNLSLFCMVANAACLILPGQQWTSSSSDTVTAIICTSRATCDLIVRSWLLSLAAHNNLKCIIYLRVRLKGCYCCNYGYWSVAGIRGEWKECYKVEDKSKFVGFL